MKDADLHRVYPHTREPFEATLHNAKWALVGVAEKAVRDYIVATRHIWPRADVQAGADGVGPAMTIAEYRAAWGRDA